MKFGPFDSVALLKPHLDAPRWALVEAWLKRDKKTAEEATISSLRDDLKGEDLYLWIGEGGEWFTLEDYNLVLFTDTDEVEVDE